MTSTTMIGVISALAAAQSRAAYHFSITAMTRWTNSEGIEEMTDDSRARPKVSGASTG